MKTIKLVEEVRQHLTYYAEVDDSFDPKNPQHREDLFLALKDSPPMFSDTMEHDTLFCGEVGYPVKAQPVSQVFGV